MGILFTFFAWKAFWCSWISARGLDQKGAELQKTDLEEYKTPNARRWRCFRQKRCNWLIYPPFNACQLEISCTSGPKKCYNIKCLRARNFLWLFRHRKNAHIYPYFHFYCSFMKQFSSENIKIYLTPYTLISLFIAFLRYNFPQTSLKLSKTANPEPPTPPYFYLASNKETTKPFHSFSINVLMPPYWWEFFGHTDLDQ